VVLSIGDKLAADTEQSKPRDRGARAREPRSLGRAGNQCDMVKRCARVFL